MFIDTHAHLFAPDFGRDIDDVVRRAEDAGVESIVCPGTDLETSRRSIELAERYSCVFAAVGIHPHDAKKAALEDGTIIFEVLEAVESLSYHPKVVAIGEIGLDYHYNMSTPNAQRVVFSEQLALARRCKLPVIIHMRESETDVMRIVQEHMQADTGEWLSRPKGVFHCFPGDSAMARQVIGWGFYVSIPGPVTFPLKPGKPNSMAEVVQNTDLSHILLETDSPYLTPHPFRGKRNEPANVAIVAEKIAELKATSGKEIGDRTNAGARKLFGLSAGMRRANG